MVPRPHKDLRRDGRETPLKPEAVTVTYAGKDEAQGTCRTLWKWVGLKPSRDMKQCSLGVEGEAALSEGLPRELQKGWGYSAVVGTCLTGTRCWVLYLASQRKGKDMREGRKERERKKEGHKKGEMEVAKKEERQVGKGGRERKGRRKEERKESHRRCP